MIYPKTTGFHWGSLDFQWYIEACKSHPGYAKTETGFHDVNRFITLEPHAGTDNISIVDYVENLAEGKGMSGTTPTELSDQIHAHADKALEILEGLDHGGNKELRLTLGDIRAIAFLGKYYAHKIRGATETLLFGNTEKQEHQAAAIRELNRAAAYWRWYTSVALGQYKNPLWMNRVGRVNWRELLNEVLKDVTIAGGTPSLRSMSPTPGGTILEAEDAVSGSSRKAAKIGGYTGTGYRKFRGATGGGSLAWIFDAPETGTYVLELRYALAGRGQYPANVRVNDKDEGSIILWTTGGESTWAWDRKPVTLRKGKNAIRLTVENTVLIDHLNVL
ncbi:MAG: carbohydrate-binding protein [Planctomycetota bacterium]|jgi:hypothetical protein